MNIKYKNFPPIALLAICTILPSQLFASQFTVTSTGDPATGNPDACAVGSAACTLRDALAAADLTAEVDGIGFAVSEPIFLRKALTATQAVTIDGGGSTTIRVDQGYNIKTLLDRPVFGNDNVQVLQPPYFSVGQPNRPMLELIGVGSVVSNIHLDGSITPLPADLGVARIDFDSNDTTDFLLYTIDSDGDTIEDRWLVAGGIYVTGSPTVSGNELTNFNNNAIGVEFSFNAVVTDNLISGGAAGQPAFSADGISFFSSAVSVVSGNTVSGFRNGMAITHSSGINVNGNELAGNINGIELDQMDTSFGQNVVIDNIVADNQKRGILVTSVSGAQITGNEVDDNSEVGIHIKTAGEISLTGNEVKRNGSGAREHGGILISEGSGLITVDSNELISNQGFAVVIDGSFGNVLSNNELKSNAGVGLILLNGAMWNQVLANEVLNNFVGMISGVENDPLFPSSNFFQGNTLQLNTAIDALDFDPVCNDAWIANTIGSSASVSDNCID